MFLMDTVRNRHRNTGVNMGVEMGIIGVNRMHARAYDANHHHPATFAHGQPFAHGQTLQIIIIIVVITTATSSLCLACCLCSRHGHVIQNILLIFEYCLCQQLGWHLHTLGVLLHEHFFKGNHQGTGAVSGMYGALFRPCFEEV